MKLTDFALLAVGALALLLLVAGLCLTRKVEHLEQQLEHERSARVSCDDQHVICEKALERTETEKCAEYDCAKAVGDCLERCAGSCFDRFIGGEI